VITAEAALDESAKLVRCYGNRLLCTDGGCAV